MDRMPKIRHSVICIVAAGLVAWPVLLSAAPDDDAESPASDTLLDQFSIRSWGITDGLPESVVTGVAQGSDGFLWLTTANALVRVDG